MNLNKKMTLMTLIPMVLLGILLVSLSGFLLKMKIYDEAYQGMDATAMTVRNVFEAGRSGEYAIREDGCLWKGDSLNISESEEILDSIKDNTGMDVTIFYGNTRYMTTVLNESGQRAIGTQADAFVEECVLGQGQPYQNDSTYILGERYLAYYIPLYQENTTRPIGMIFLGQKYADVQGSVQTAMLQLMIVAIALISVTVISTFFFVRTMTGAFEKGIQQVKIISEGKIGSKMPEKLLKRRDDIGDMCRSVEKLDETLYEIITGIQRQSDMVLDASNALSSSADNVTENINRVDEAVGYIATASTQQAQDAADAGVSVSTMADLLVDTENDIAGLKKETDTMATSAMSVKSTLEELNQSMLQVRDAIDLVRVQSDETNKAVIHIEEVTQLITAIASQTSLLSLNASIEAARAGEHGRGFAVVASEIQDLSARSDESASEIQQILVQLKQNSEKTVQVMEKLQETIAVQEEKIQRSNEVFQAVHDGVERSNEMLESLDQKSVVLNDARNTTTTVVNSVAAIAEENAASTEETAASLEEVDKLMQQVDNHAKTLNTIAESLKQSLEVFQMIED